MKISVVTPSFRQVGLLKDCARSVADQAGAFEHEHLVEDGGSGEEFERWSGEQEFADVRSGPDAGMYDAINKGFRRASGDVLCWLNCDEQYLPGTLDKVARWFGKNPDKDGLVGDVVLVDPGGRPLAYRTMVGPSLRHTQYCFLASYSAATFVRRSVIERGHFLDTTLRATADSLWVWRMLRDGVRFGVLNEPLATFGMTGGNLGLSEEFRGEGIRWRKDEGVWKGRWLGKPLHGNLHRLNKFLRGAYRRREICVEIHLPGREGRRKRCAVVGGRWGTAG